MKKSVMRFILISSAFSPAASAKTVDAPVDPGPPPASFEAFKQAAEPILLQGFFDPGAAQINWDRGFASGYWKPVLSKKVPGWFTCGLVNGKNRFGGYVGARRFVVVYNHGSIVFSQIGDGGNYDFVAMACAKAIANGILPLATSMPEVNASQPVSSVAGFAPTVAGSVVGRLGMAYTIVPDGVYISSVSGRGAAFSAGLRAGMIITQINAVPIAGYGNEMIEIMLAATDITVVTTSSGGNYPIKKSE